MNWHEFLDDDLRDLASLYVLGALEDDEAREYRLHLPACEACRNEVESLAITAGRMTLAAPRIAPRPELWSRVLDRIRGNAVSTARPSAGTSSRPVRETPAVRTVVPNQVWKSWTTVGPQAAQSGSREGFLDADVDANAFEPTGIDGIDVRRLAVDRAKEQVTMLVRMAPGTSYPAHRHGGAEECFVVQGDLHVGDRHMRSGDFQRAEPGTIHPIQTTDGGCTLLIVSSTTDELLDEN